MDIMNINSNSSYDIGSNYSSKTNKEDKQAQDIDKKSEFIEELSVEEQQLVTELQARDTEVKTHEAAHQAAGGGMTGGASYTYQQGPDGKTYAIGGEVSISMKSGSTPQETIANARKVVAAAMAPANPSGQDMAVASSAKVMEMKAQQQLVKEQMELLQGKDAYGEKPDSSEPLKSFDISA